MLTIRRATTDDAAAIGRIQVSTWRTAYAEIMPAEFLAGLDAERSAAAWRSRVAGDPSTLVLVGLDGEEVAGFASGGKSRDVDAGLFAGELYAIYLDPARWQRGAGRQLHDHALEALRVAGYSELTLWVLADNARARRFYERAGWQADGSTKVDSALGSPPLTEVRYAHLVD